MATKTLGENIFNFHRVVENPHLEVVNPQCRLGQKEILYLGILSSNLPLRIENICFVDYAILICTDIDIKSSTTEPYSRGNKESLDLRVPYLSQNVLLRIISIGFKQ